MSFSPVSLSKPAAGDTALKQILGAVFRFMPLWFGLGFLAPLIGQTLAMSHVSLPGGIAPIWIGLFIGGVWGAIATRTGRWF